MTLAGLAEALGHWYFRDRCVHFAKVKGIVEERSAKVDHATPNRWVVSSLAIAFARGTAIT